MLQISAGDFPEKCKKTGRLQKKKRLIEAAAASERRLFSQSAGGAEASAHVAAGKRLKIKPAPHVRTPGAQLE